MRNEFDGLTLYDADGDPVPGLSAVPTAYYNEFGVWTNVGIVAAQLAGMEVLKLVLPRAWHTIIWLVSRSGTWRARVPALAWLASDQPHPLVIRPASFLWT